jgi:phasin
MTMTFDPDSAANKTAEFYKPLTQFQSLEFDTAIPEAMRAFAGNAVTQTREAYDRAKTALDAGLEAVERSCDAASRATSALNRKIIDIAQRNVNSSFDLAKDLASARNLAEIVELQGAFWRKQLDTLLAQAEEVRALSLHAGADVAEPIQRHAAKQGDEVRALSRRITAEAAETIKRQATQLEHDLRKAS